LTDTLALLALMAPVRTGCARCGESHYGSLEAGREWFAEHLATSHPDVHVNARPKSQPPLHRIDRRD